MKYYIISNGSCSDYNYIMLSHEKEFTKKEFATMYNNIVKEYRIASTSAISAKFEEKHGFKIIDELYEINNRCGFYEMDWDDEDDDDFPQVDETEMQGEHRVMEAE